MVALVLASSSPHRRELLARLGLPFATEVPDVDETSLPDETPEELVVRLSELKARAVVPRQPGALIIGSDQVAAVAAVGGTGERGKDKTEVEAPGAPLATAKPSPVILGKPGSRSAAIEQLRMLSGQQVDFLTGLCVIDPAGQAQVAIERTQVLFRELTDSEITTYVEREQPFDCAASFKSEKLGITLVDAIRGTDPNALVGLPLIRLCQMLRQAGANPLEPPLG